MNNDLDKSNAKFNKVYSNILSYKVQYNVCMRLVDSISLNRPLYQASGYQTRALWF